MASNELLLKQTNKQPQGKGWENREVLIIWTLKVGYFTEEVFNIYWKHKGRCCSSIQWRPYYTWAP